jgi:tripartite-type tricarboxylate transporter receptor subunit TctC
MIVYLLNKSTIGFFMKFVKHFALAAGLIAVAGLVQAQAWPAKPITIINPFPAGGGTDAFARPLSAALAKSLGKSVIIDNRGGAGGTLGAAIAAKAAPDGYTFFMGAIHHTIAPSMYPKLDYDLEKDFVPMAVVALVPQVLVINPNKVPVNSLKEFGELVKKSPGKFNYATSGNGTSHHLAAEVYKMQTKSFITHIPYRGAGPAIGDLIAGQVDMMFDGMGSSAAHIKGGRIKAIAISAPKRVAAFPNLPTFAEQGMPDYNVTTWYGLWAIKGTPKDIQDKMLAETLKAMNTPELKEVWNNQAAVIGPDNTADMTKFVSSEIKKWAEAAKKSGAKLD